MKKNHLPKGFVYLKEIAPDIYQSLDYGTPFNFTGAVVPGYEAPEAILTQQAAEALALVQEDVSQEGFSLVVYDAYRPNRAVNFFLDWQKTPEVKALKALYYPFLSKDLLFEKGYLSRQSAHSRGSTVDLSLIPQGKSLIPFPKRFLGDRLLPSGHTIPFCSDGTIDMEGHFDLFDLSSHHDSRLVSPEALERRNFLKEKMLKRGFLSYMREWWHYTLQKEPFLETFFDFPFA